MKRIATIAATIVCALFVPGGALAASYSGRGTVTVISGTVTEIDGSIVTIQTAGRQTGVINALTETADAITQRDYPYVWGGGHAEAGVASIGSKGPGHNGRRIGLDCSGSVAAVLAGAGLWPAGASVPGDSGVIQQLRDEHLIAPGAGDTPDEVTLYDDPGVHIFMNIDGRFFGTSDGAGGGNRRGGAGWLYDSADDATDRAFKKFHFLPAVLKDATAYGHLFTFQASAAAESDLPNLEIGDKVTVGYTETRAATMIAGSIAWVGALTGSGTIASVSADGSSITIATATRATLTLQAAPGSSVLSNLQVGDTITVIYTRNAGALTARQTVVTAVPTPATPGGGVGQPQPVLNPQLEHV